MAKRRRAKSWEEYDAYVAGKEAYTKKYVAEVERTAFEEPEKASHYLHRPEVVKVFANNQDKVSRDTLQWYKENGVPAAAAKPGYQPRTESQEEEDPKAKEAIRNSVLDSINSELYSEEDQAELELLRNDPEAARQAIAEMTAEQGGSEPPVLMSWLEDLGAGYMWFNHQITHPFTAAAIATNPKSEANGDWAKAWEQSSAEDFEHVKPKQYGTDKPAISIGQALAANERISAPLGSSDIGEGKDTVAESMFNMDLKYGDPNSDEMRDYLENTLLGKASSGSLDFAQQFLGDGLTLALKGLKTAGEASRLTAKSGVLTSRTDQINKLRNMLEVSLPATDGGAGQANALGELSDWMLKQVGPQGETAIRTRLKKMGAGDRGDIAHMFAATTAENGGRKKMDLLLRASWNDPEAIKEIRTVDPAHYAELFNRHHAAIKSQLDEAEMLGIDPAVITGENADAFTKALYESAGFKADGTGAMTGTADIAADAVKTPTDITDLMFKNPDLANSVLQSYAEKIPALAKDLDLALNPELNVIGSLGMANLGGLGSNLGKRFATKSMQTSNKSAEIMGKSDFTFAKRGAIVSTFKENPLAATISVIRWPAREKPNGMVQVRGINKEGSTDEVASFLNSPRMLRDAKFADFKGRMMSLWGGASQMDAHAPAAVRQIEEETFSLLATEYARVAAKRRGLREGTTEYNYHVRTWADEKKEAFRQVQAKRDEAMLDHSENGYTIDQLAEGKPIVKSPQLQAHLEDSVPMLDLRIFERQLKQAVRNPNLKWVETAKDAGDTAVRLNQGFQSVWRPLVLLRAAYPIRNTIEGSARVLGFAGLTGVWQQYMDTGAVIAGNTARRAGRVSGSVGRAQKGLTAASSVYDRRMHTLNEFKNGLQQQVDEIASMDDLPFGLRPGANFNHDEFVDLLKAQGDADELVALRERLSFDLDKHLTDVDALNTVTVKADAAATDMAAAEAKLDSKLGNRTIGEANVSRVLADGTVVETAGPFGGIHGRVAKSASGNDQTWGYMAGSVNSRRQGELRKKLMVTDTRVTSATMDDYRKAVYDMTNNILNDSQVTKMRLDPSVTGEDFVNWFYSRQGRFERAAQESFGRNVDDWDAMSTWFESGRENLLATFPDEEFRSKIAAGKVTEADIVRYTDKVGGEKLPDIVGDRVLDMHGAKKEGVGLWRQMTQKLFHIAGAVPEGALVRRPYYSFRFNEYLDEVVKGMDKASIADADTYAKLMNEAHRYALRRLRRDIYTVQRQKNLPSLIENVSPFWTAQINTATTWPRIIAERPETLGGIARTYVRMREANMIDDEGYFNPVPGIRLNGEYTGGLDVRIPLANVLSIFAGQPNEVAKDLPGGQFVGFFAPVPGPQSAVIASEMQKGTFGFKQLGDMMPDGLYDTFAKAANPIGPSTEALSLDMLLPSYGRTIFAALQGEGNGTYDAMASKILKLEYAKFDWGLRGEPTLDEIYDLTNKLFGTMIVGAFTAPGAPRAVSPIEPIVMKAREFQMKYGYLNGIDKFLDIYGEEWAAAMMRGSKNQLGFGVTQSKEAWAVLQENEGLVRTLANSGDTKLVSLLMGETEQNGKFDTTIRRLMLQTPIPGGEGNMLKQLSPDEMMDALKIERGWREFKSQYSTWREAKVSAWKKKYGSEDLIPSEKWAVLSEKRKSVVAAIGVTNDKWATEYNGQANKGREALAALRAIRSNNKFWSKAKSDPYWQKVSEFIDLHDDTSRVMKGQKPKNPAQTPDDFFAWNARNNAEKGYSFSADKQAEFRAKVMKDFKDPSSERYKQWQLAKYQSKVSELKNNTRFNDMFDRWFGGEAYDDDAF